MPFIGLAAGTWVLAILDSTKGIPIHLMLYSTVASPPMLPFALFVQDPDAV
jgi:hypothetical protein